MQAASIVCRGCGALFGEGGYSGRYILAQRRKKVALKGRKVLFNYRDTLADIYMSAATEDDPFRPHGRAFWEEFARRQGVWGGADTLAVKFTAAKDRGESNSQAARSAGAGGAPNAAGYRLSKSNEVARLMAALAAETGSDVGNVDARRARAILSRLAEGSDPSVRIRAIECLQRMDEREAQEGRDNDNSDPTETARRLVDAAGEFGALVATGIYFKQAQTLYGLPLAETLLPIVRLHFPEALMRILDALPPGHLHHRKGIELLASGPVVSIEEIAGDHTPEKANGRAKPDAEAIQQTAAS